MCPILEIMSRNKIVLFDTHESFENLLPLSYTRPVGAFRVGIMKIYEKWERLTECETSFLPVDYLRGKFSVGVSAEEEAFFVAGKILPDSDFVDSVLKLKAGEGIYYKEELLACRGSLVDFEKGEFVRCEYAGDVELLQYVYDIFLQNGEQIRRDYPLLVKGRESAPLDPTVRVVGDTELADGLPSVFVEEGADLCCITLNVKDGPIYIGRDATIMEGTCVRGPFAMCDHALVKMGAKIYGKTTLGPYCKVGGEVSNLVMFGYSNKAHDGYLGNAVIGEWCNLGAGANASNLKNDYSKIRIWNYARQGFMRTDLQFCGLIMGDHSKAGINTMFNTATVVGVGVNLHGGGFPRTFIPSFQTGSPEGGFEDVSIDKLMDVAGKVMARRGLTLGEDDRKILEFIYNSAARFK